VGRDVLEKIGDLARLREMWADDPP